MARGIVTRLDPRSLGVLLLLSALGCTKTGAGPGAAPPSEVAEAAAGPGSVPSAAADDWSAPNAAGYRFRSVAIGGGGFVTGLIPSRARPGLWYARTDVGGAYRWNQASKSWTALTDWVSDEQTGYLGVESLALDPQAPERVYLLVGIAYQSGGKTAILRSSDYGQSFDVIDVTRQFKAHGNGMGRQSGEKLAVDPGNGDHLLVGTRDRGLFESRNRGASWQRLAALDVTGTQNENGIAFVLFDPAAKGSRVYVGVSRSQGDHLYLSSDGGQSFQPVAGQPRGFTPQRAALSATGSLFVTYGNGPGPHPHASGPMDHGAVWKLETTTGVWTEITPLRGTDNRAFGGISLDAQRPGRVLASTINTWLEQPWGHGDRFFLSTDGGASWVDLIATRRLAMDAGAFPWIAQHSMHWAGSIEIDPFDSERAMVTSGNGVFMTENLSGSPSLWTFAARGLEETVPLDAASLPDGAFVSVIGDSDGFLHTDVTVPSAAGTHQPNTGTTNALAVAAKNPSVLARSGKEMFRSEDGGKSWHQLTRPADSDGQGGRLALSADGSVLLWAIRQSAYRSADAGKTWEPIAGLDFVTAPSADSVDASRFYAYDPASGRFFVSSDGGRSFRESTQLPAGGSARLRTVPDRAGDVWVALYANGLARSQDGGREFKAVPSLSHCSAIGFGRSAANADFPAAYVWGTPPGKPSGLYRSDDAGASWLRINDDAHQYGGPGNGQFVLGDAKVYGRVYLSTAGRGIIVGTPQR